MFSTVVSNDGNYLILDTRKNTDDINLVSYAELNPENEINGPLNFKPLISSWISGFSYIHNIGNEIYFKTNY